MTTNSDQVAGKEKEAITRMKDEKEKVMMKDAKEEPRRRRVMTLLVNIHLEELDLLELEVVVFLMHLSDLI